MNLEHVLDELVEGAPVQRADWADVEARARPRRPRALIVAGVVAAAVAVALPGIGVAGRIAGLFGGDPVDPATVPAADLHVLGAMSAGVSPRRSASAAEDLARVGAAAPRLVAARGGRVFYAADRRGGGLCVAVAPVTADRPLASITCAADFPSEARPVLDLSTFGGTPASPEPLRLEGFAADGVASVGLEDAESRVVATAAVRGNVYQLAEGLPSGAVGALVAFDAAGRRVYRNCFASSRCAAG